MGYLAGAGIAIDDGCGPPLKTLALGGGSRLASGERKGLLVPMLGKWEADASVATLCGVREQAGGSFWPSFGRPSEPQ